MSVATIGSALRERRQELGLEKGQAADKIGMSRTTYSSYEQDAQRPSVDVFPALAGFLEISMERLLVLYGATCVASVRPSLERLLSSQPEEQSKGSTLEAVSSESESDTNAPALSDLPDVHVVRAEEWLEENLSVETRALTEAPEVPDTESSPTSEESSLEWLNVLEDSEQESLPEVETSPAPESVVEFENSEPVDQAGKESLTSSETSDSLEEQTDAFRDSPLAETLGSTAYEPSPFVITVPRFDGNDKNSGHKKKKKKKKKK